MAGRDRPLQRGAPSATFQREGTAEAGRSAEPVEAIWGGVVGLPSSAEDRAAECGNAKGILL